LQACHWRRVDYRPTWTFPPLQHRDRKTIVDVHHTILAPTGRLHPDRRKLLEAAVPVEGTKFSVLAPTDMVLHSAAHAFQDGDFQRVLRDLVDLDDLLRHFGARRSFWNEFLSRAEQLELTRPLFYGMRYAHGVLNTPVPDFVSAQCRRWRPAWPALFIMDQLVSHAVGSIEPGEKANGLDFLCGCFISDHTGSACRLGSSRNICCERLSDAGALRRANRGLDLFFQSWTKRPQEIISRQACPEQNRRDAKSTKNQIRISKIRNSRFSWRPLRI
jgi:hypothetical protein